MMDKQVLRKIERKLENSINKYTPVVWLDPWNQYLDYVDKVDLSANLIKYNGSFMEIRYKIENEDPKFDKRWIVYVPKSKEDSDWLREYWLIGDKLEKEISATKILDELGYKISREEREQLKNKDLSHQLVSNPEKALEKKDTTSKKAIKFQIGKALQIDKFDFFKVTSKFLSHKNKVTKRVKEKDLINDFLELFTNQYGVKDNIDLDDLYENLINTLFFGELSQNSNVDLSDYKNFLPLEKKQVNCSEFVERWQDSRNLQESFEKAEKKFSEDFPDIVNKDNSINEIKGIKGIKKVDELLIKKLDSKLSKNCDFSRFLKIIGNRKNTYWGKRGTNQNSNDWDYLFHSYKMVKLSKDFDKIENVEKIYTEKLWKIDFQYRKSFEKFPMTKFISESPSFIKSKYQEFLRTVNDKFYNSFEVKKTNLPLQTQIFDRLEDGSVLFVLDALRFELANEFEGYKSIKPYLSLLPSITKTGMAGLLPDAENNLKFTENDDELDISLNGISVNSKTQRIDYLKSKNVVTFKSIEILSEDEFDLIKTCIEDGKNVVVYSRNIDLLGENLEDVSISNFKKLLGRVQQKIDKLQSKGVDKIYVTTDHGFLYKPKEMSSESIKKPEGKLINFGSRYSVGKYIESENGRSIDIKDYGVQTDLEFFFPRSLGIFQKRGRGRKFLHGGISLQELIIPLVEFGSKSSIHKPMKVEIEELPNKITNPLFKIKLRGLSSELISKERIVRIETTQYGNKISEDVYSSITLNEENKEMIKLDTEKIENRNGPIVIEIFDDKRNIRLDRKKLELDILYEGDGL